MFGRGEDLLGVQEADATSKKKESVTELLHGMVMLSVSSGGKDNVRGSPASTPTSEDSMDTSVSLTSQGLTTSTHDCTEMDSEISEAELDAPNPTSSSFGSFSLSVYASVEY
ncbi:hypothetical protein AAVH_07777 [Aphelenchoides avenae]|nr:hypothetical protein AAVH_07777 [Aphelenchus avenae]